MTVRIMFSGTEEVGSLLQNSDGSYSVEGGFLRFKRIDWHNPDLNSGCKTEELV